MGEWCEPGISAPVTVLGYANGRFDAATFARQSKRNARTVPCCKNYNAWLLKLFVAKNL
jgi:hypothetical protein